MLATNAVFLPNPYPCLGKPLGTAMHADWRGLLLSHRTLIALDLLHLVDGLCAKQLGAAFITHTMANDEKNSRPIGGRLEIFMEPKRRKLVNQ